MGNFIPAFLFTKAETGITHSLTGMLNSLTPLFTLILGVLFFKNKTRWVNVIGIIIGFCGALGLILVGSDTSSNEKIWYGALVVLATVFYAISVNTIKKFLGEVHSISITAYAFLFVGPPAGLYLFATDFTDRLNNNPKAWSSLGFIVILAVVGTALAVVLFNSLIKHTSALFASSVTYLIPVFAILWGLFDQEEILTIHLLFIGIILIGVSLVNKKEKTKTIK